MTKYFCPGPIDLPDTIKEELLVEPPYFGGSDFHAIIKKIQPQLQLVFKTTNPILLCTGSGSLLMEQAITNFFSPNDKIVVINNGRYGQHWIDCARAYGLRVKEITSILSEDSGFSVPLDEIELWLKSHPDTQGVFCQHVETTTGIKNDIQKISEYVRKYTDALFLVDAISSLLSEDIQTTNWDLDVVLASSQKGLSLPAGLGFISVSKKAEEFSMRSTFPKYYFNIPVELERQIVKNQTRFTPATHVIICLSKALDIIENNVDPILRKASDLAALLQSFLFGNRILTSYSNTLNSTVTVGLLPKHILAETFFKKMEQEYGYILGKGTELIKSRGVRIRTFGWDLKYSQLSPVLYSIDNTIIDIEKNQ